MKEISASYSNDLKTAASVPFGDAWHPLIGTWEDASRRLYQNWSILNGMKHCCRMLFQKYREGGTGDRKSVEYYGNFVSKML